MKSGLIQRTIEHYAENYHRATNLREQISTDLHAKRFIDEHCKKEDDRTLYWLEYSELKARR